MKSGVRTIIGLTMVLMLLGFTGCGDKKESGGKKELVILATDSMENLLEEFIVEYNKQSEEYYITYEDFGWKPGGPEVLSDKINAKIVSEHCPDVVLINYNLFQVYMDAEALEDLTPYVENSKSIATEAFKEPVIKAFEKNNALYGIPRNFSVTGMAGRTDQVGELQGWNIEEFITYFEQNPDVVLEWDGDDYGILNFCLRYGLENYVDFEEGKCDFDTEKFKALLTRIKALNREDSYVDNFREHVEDGGKFLLDLPVNSFDDYKRMEAEYQDSLTILGYPGSVGNANCRLLPENAIGMFANSKNKEAAWDVIEKYMEFDFGFEEYSFSAIENTFNQQLALAKEAPEVTEHNELTKEEALTQEQELQVLYAIENAVPDDVIREKIRTMVTEEALHYFLDRKSLEETVDIIQKRVQLYIEEWKL